MLFAITRKLTEVEQQAQFLINQAKQIKLAKVLLDQALSSLSDAVNVAKETTPDIVDLLKEDIVENLNTLLNIDIPAPEVTEAIAPEVTEAIAPEVTEAIAPEVTELELEGFELVEDEEVKPEVSTDEPETKQLDLVEAIAEKDFKVGDLVVRVDETFNRVYSVQSVKKDNTIVVKQVFFLMHKVDGGLELTSRIMDDTAFISSFCKNFNHYKPQSASIDVSNFYDSIYQLKYNFYYAEKPVITSVQIGFTELSGNDVKNISEELEATFPQIIKYIILLNGASMEETRANIIVVYTLNNEINQIEFETELNETCKNYFSPIANTGKIHADQVVIADPDGQFPSYYYVETLNGDKATVMNCYIDEYASPLFTSDHELYDLRIETLTPLLTQCSNIVKATQEVNCIEKAYKQEYNSKLIAIHLYIKSKKSHLTKILKDWEIKYLMTESLLEQTSKGVYAVRLFNIKDYDQLMSQILSLDSLIERCEKITIPKPKTKQEDSPEDRTEEMPF